ncbi:MAG: nitrous oxide reductase family maturation protein NosD, partial [Acidimicrobiales bacterium]
MGTQENPRPDGSVGSRVGTRPDPVASLTIVAVAAVALASAWVLPWWIMKARAPQYGQRTLVIQIGPRTVDGDVREVDMLGHYVGIRPMGTLARVERALAPLGMVGAFGGILLTPWVRRRWLRCLLVVPALIMPFILLVDLKVWMDMAVNERDPNASLNLTVSRINPKLFGEYEVGQFKVATELGGGFYLCGVAGLLGLGLAFAAPLRARRGQLVALLAGVGLLAGLRSSPAHAENLGAGGEQSTIAAALAAAADGDTVIVPPGIHREHLVVERPVHLVGSPGAVLDGGGEGTVLRITAPGVEVRGLTVRASGDSYTTEDAGIRIDHAADVR